MSEKDDFFKEFGNVKWVLYGNEMYEKPTNKFRWLVKKNGEKVLQQLVLQDKFDWEKSKSVWKDIKVEEEQ